jgi:hypothetical protein
MFTIIFIDLVTLSLTGCSGDGPAESAKVWASARANQRGGEALKQTCEELREDVQNGTMMEASLFGLFQFFSGILHINVGFLGTEQQLLL